MCIAFSRNIALQSDLQSPHDMLLHISRGKSSKENRALMSGSCKSQICGSTKHRAIFSKPRRLRS